MNPLDEFRPDQNNDVSNYILVEEEPGSYLIIYKPDQTMFASVDDDTVIRKMIDYLLSAGVEIIEGLDEYLRQYPEEQ
jgi:hypothetical protein